MKHTEAMIAWNPGTDEIAVGPWPDKTRWSDAYLFTAGACTLSLHTASKSDRLAQLMIDFNTCVVRDCVDAQSAHRAFLAIDEYRRRIPPDQLGAEDEDGPTNKPWQKVVKERLDHKPSPYRRPPSD